MGVYTKLRNTRDVFKNKYKKKNLSLQFFFSIETFSFIRRCLCLCFIEFFYYEHRYSFRNETIKY